MKTRLKSKKEVTLGVGKQIQGIETPWVWGVEEGKKDTEKKEKQWSVNHWLSPSQFSCSEKYGNKWTSILKIFIVFFMLTLCFISFLSQHTYKAGPIISSTLYTARDTRFSWHQSQKPGTMVNIHVPVPHPRFTAKFECQKKNIY